MPCCTSCTTPVCDKPCESSSYSIVPVTIEFNASAGTPTATLQVMKCLSTVRCRDICYEVIFSANNVQTKVHGGATTDFKGRFTFDVPLLLQSLCVTVKILAKDKKPKSSCCKSCHDHDAYSCNPCKGVVCAHVTALFTAPTD